MKDNTIKWNKMNCIISSWGICVFKGIKIYEDMNMMICPIFEWGILNGNSACLLGLNLLCFGVVSLVSFLTSTLYYFWLMRHTAVSSGTERIDLIPELTVLSAHIFSASIHPVSSLTGPTLCQLDIFGFPSVYPPGSSAYLRVWVQITMFFRRSRSIHLPIKIYIY